MIKLPLPVYAVSSVIAITALTATVYRQHEEIKLLSGEVRLLQEGKDRDNAAWKKAVKERDILFVQNRDLQGKLNVANTEIYALRDSWRIARENELTQLPSGDFHKSPRLSK